MRARELAKSPHVLAPKSMYSYNAKRTYRWLHIPSGETGASQTEAFISHQEFEALVNQWNYSGGRVWKYWY